VLRTLNLVRDNFQAGVSDGAVVAGFVMVATAVCTMMATVAGWALVLVIVDGASGLRRIERRVGRSTLA
jgi:hypothetical protein